MVVLVFEALMCSLFFDQFSSDSCGCCELGIDGLVDMKHICGITVARRKGKPGKEDKVSDQKLKVYENLTLCVWKFSFFPTAKFLSIYISK